MFHLLVEGLAVLLDRFTVTRPRRFPTIIEPDGRVAVLLDRCRIVDGLGLGKSLSSLSFCQAFSAVALACFFG